MEKQTKEKIILKDAILDLEKELKNLKQQKKTITTKISNTTGNITDAQISEEKLRNEIAKLVAKEGLLEKKRNRLKEKLDETSGKISKVKSIKDQLTDVEES